LYQHSCYQCFDNDLFGVVSASFFINNISYDGIKDHRCQAEVCEILHHIPDSPEIFIQIHKCSIDYVIGHKFSGDDGEEYPYPREKVYTIGKPFLRVIQQSAGIVVSICSMKEEYSYNQNHCKHFDSALLIDEVNDFEY